MTKPTKTKPNTQSVACVLGEGVQDWIDALPTTHRSLFDQLHGLVLDTAPEVVVVISYKIPCYKLGKRKISIDQWRNGITLCAMTPAHIEAFKKAHPEYKTGKISVQFTNGDTLPEGDIASMINVILAS